MLTISNGNLFKRRIDFHKKKLTTFFSNGLKNLLFIFIASSEQQIFQQKVCSKQQVSKFVVIASSKQQIFQQTLCSKQQILQPIFQQTVCSRFFSKYFVACGIDVTLASNLPLQVVYLLHTYFSCFFRFGFENEEPSFLTPSSFLTPAILFPVALFQLMWRKNVSLVPVALLKLIYKIKRAPSLFGVVLVQLMCKQNAGVSTFRQKVPDYTHFFKECDNIEVKKLSFMKRFHQILLTSICNTSKCKHLTPHIFYEEIPPK